MVVPVFGMTTGQTGADALANQGPARAAYERLLAGGVPSGVLTPLEVLTPNAKAEVGRLIQGLPGARFVWLPDCGHVPMSDDPGLVAKVLLEGSAP